MVPVDTLVSLLLEFTTVSLELDCTSAELLDSLVALKLDSSVTTEDEDSSTLDEDSATLLLDSGSEPGMTEEEDSPFSIEDDDSTPGSSFGSADADDESSHAARNANNTREIATHFVLAMTRWMDPITAPFDKLWDQRLQDDRSRIFFIKASK